jgi:sugar-specific transcriptional regulator TrmB
MKLISGRLDLSLERIFRTLLDLELSKTDAYVYIHLATKGPAKARIISHNLKINRQQLYRSLRNLRVKKIVDSNLEYPAIFNAVPFEKALKILIKIKEEQAEKIEEKKSGLLSIWESITKEEIK